MTSRPLPVAGMETTPLSDQDLLARLGAPDAALLGAGGEAKVYALPGQRVARILRPGARREDAQMRTALLSEIAASAATLSFRTPVVLELIEMGDRIAVLEERLPGEPVSKLLERLHGSARESLIEDYLDTALRIRQARVTRPWFGPLHGERAQRAGRWSDYLNARLRSTARRCPADLRAAVLAEAGRKWPEPAQPTLVHLDYFPANVLAEGDGITAVLDFGASSVRGDPRFEAWSAVAYLDAEISSQARDDDRMQVWHWLERQGLVEGYDEARRWLAASWSFATDDASLMEWCRRVLLAEPSA